MFWRRPVALGCWVFSSVEFTCVNYLSVGDERLPFCRQIDMSAAIRKCRAFGYDYLFVTAEIFIDTKFRVRLPVTRHTTPALAVHLNGPFA
jgi:hypothetical protein